MINPCFLAFHSFIGGHSCGNFGDILPSRSVGRSRASLGGGKARWRQTCRKRDLLPSCPRRFGASLGQVFAVRAARLVQESRNGRCFPRRSGGQQSSPPCRSPSAKEARKGNPELQTYMDGTLNRFPEMPGAPDHRLSAPDLSSWWNPPPRRAPRPALASDDQGSGSPDSSGATFPTHSSQREDHGFLQGSRQSN